MTRPYSSLIVLVLLFAIPIITNASAPDCSKSAKLLEESKSLLAANPAAAEIKLREAVDSCNQSASLHYNLGLALLEQKKYKDAEIELETATRLKDSYARAMNALAIAVYGTKDGDFKRAMALAKQATQLEPRNKYFQQTLETLQASVDTPPTTSVNNPDAIAVIIGNRSYSDPRVPTVEYADFDAKTVKNYLMNTLGFKENNIIFVPDARYIDFKKIFGDEHDHHGTLFNWSKADRSDIFIYYSGHGVPDTNTRKAYLAPIDIDPFAVRMTGYSLETLYENLARLSSEKKPKSITIVLDACFSGATNNGMLIKDASPVFVEISSPMLAARNAAVITSSQGNQISSWYPEQKHGLFTYFFLKTIKDAAANGKTLSISEMEKSLTAGDSVNDYALKLYNREQAPQVLGNKDIVLIR